jgi:predicted small lipoprotein YifL
MKTKYIWLAILAAFIALAACRQKKPEQNAADAGTQRKVAETVPAFVRDALKNAPQDALVGIGTAKMSTLSMSRVTAATRARAEIARQINLVVSQMVHEYTAASATDPAVLLLFQERVTTTASVAGLSGLSVIDEDMDGEGNYWVVVMMGKEPVSDAISQAQNQVKDDFPQMSSFDVGEMLTNALESVVKAEIAVAR